VLTIVSPSPPLDCIKGAALCLRNTVCVNCARTGLWGGRMGNIGSYRQPGPRDVYKLIYQRYLDRSTALTSARAMEACTSKSCTCQTRPVTMPYSNHSRLCCVESSALCAAGGERAALWQVFPPDWREYQPGTLVRLDRLWKFFSRYVMGNNAQCSVFSSSSGSRWPRRILPRTTTAGGTLRRMPPLSVWSCALWWQGQDSHKGVHSMPRSHHTRVHTQQAIWHERP